MQMLVWVHLVGMVVFVGAGLAAGAVFRQGGGAADPKPLDGAAVTLARLASAGAVLVFGSGIGLMFAARMIESLGHELWLILMIVLGLAATALSGIAGARMRRGTGRSTTMLLWGLFLVVSLGAIATGVWRVRM